MNEKPAQSFEQAATQPHRVGFLGELWGFLRDNKKWWLLPVLVVVVAMSLLIFLSGTAVAPFIYTFF
jgi:hypothetical protein